MINKNSVVTKFIVVLALLLAMLCSLFGNILTTPISSPMETAQASTSFDSSNVVDDLKSMKINGKDFSLSDYGFLKGTPIQVLTFLEYGYSTDIAKINDYGLYVYLYNPGNLTGVDFTGSTTKIQLGVGEDKSSLYNQYRLTFLNKSTENGYVGLFYKYRVDIDVEQRTAIFKYLNSDRRVYKVSGIEFSSSTDFGYKEVGVEGTYVYTGFMKGFGSDESTLKCQQEDLFTLTLDVHSTYYRPEGNNGKDQWTRDSLHSVYFSVPNSYIETFGEMSAVHAIWTNAVLKPMLVTGHKSFYNSFFSNGLVGKDVSVEDFNYFLAGNLWYVNDKYGIGTKAYSFRYGYNLPDEDLYHIWMDVVDDKYKESSALYNVFYSGDGDESADSYIVSSDDLKESMLKVDNYMTGVQSMYGNRYAYDQFETVDSKATEVNLKADEIFPLSSFVLNESYWQRLFGEYWVDKSNAFAEAKAIYPVSEMDMLYSDDVLSDKLLIAEQDVKEFRDFYEEEKTDSTVYLFRYRISDYTSVEATLLQHRLTDFGDAIFNYNEINTNAYFFQQSVDLDFDIIDVTFSDGVVDTVIPVISSTQDIIHDGEPPIETTPDDEGLFPELDNLWDMIKIVLFLTVAGIVIAILWPVLVPLFRFVFKALFWLITLPFKLLGKFFTWIGSLFKKKDR